MEKLPNEFEFTLAEWLGEGDTTVYKAKLNGSNYDITWDDEDCPDEGVDYTVNQVEEIVKDKDWLVVNNEKN